MNAIGSIEKSEVGCCILMYEAALVHETETKHKKLENMSISFC